MAKYKRYQVRDLRRYIIGIVQQEPVLLSGTILENIVYGLTSSEINRLTMQDIIDVPNKPIVMILLLLSLMDMIHNWEQRCFIIGWSKATYSYC